MPINLLIENVPDRVVGRLQQRAGLNRRSIQDELLAILETAVREERQDTTPGFAEEHQSAYGAPREASPLEEVLEQVQTLPDERQQELAQVLLAYLDEDNSDFGLSPEQIAEIERRLAYDGPYVSDEEAREVFARLRK
jgi:plasmid stability protein